MKPARWIALLALAMVAAALLAPFASADEPRLLNGSVSATSSDENAVYVFMVTYQSNVSAQSVRLILNGNSYDMQQFDAADSNSSDGKAYFYSTKLPAGMNTYSFTCSDGSGGTNTTAAKLILVKEVPWITVTHLDVMLALFIFIPFVVYFVWLARRMTKTLEKIEKRQEKGEEKKEGEQK